MADDVDSPFWGLSWAYVGYTVGLAVLVLALTLLVVMGWRDSGWASRLLVLATLACGIWSAFWVATSVHVPNPEDPDGAECLMDPFGDNPDHTIDWDSDCGRALERHLWVSIGPAVVAAGVSSVVIPTMLVRRRVRRAMS